MSPHNSSSPAADFNSSRDFQTICYAMYTCPLASARAHSRLDHVTCTSYTRGTPFRATHISSHSKSVTRSMIYVVPHLALAYA